MGTASVIVIGSEILTGKFADENGPYFIRRFRALGVDLVRLVTIHDDLATIADEVRRCAAVSDHVFTTGGVGPTHDDLTFDGVAAAFGLGTFVHPEMAALVAAHGGDADPLNVRMATVPEGAELVWPTLASFPIVKVRNVWVLPGVPQLVKQKFEAVASRFAGVEVACVRVFARDRESDVATPIADVARDFPQVTVGSYPRWGDPSHRLIVTLESREPDALRRAAEALAQRLDVVRTEGP